MWERLLRNWTVLLVVGIVSLGVAVSFAATRRLFHENLVAIFGAAWTYAIAGAGIVGWLGLGAHLSEGLRRLVVAVLQSRIGTATVLLAPYVSAAFLAWWAFTREVAEFRCSEALRGDVEVRVGGAYVIDPCTGGVAAGRPPLLVEASAPGFVPAQGRLGVSSWPGRHEDGRWFIDLRPTPRWTCTKDSTEVDADLEMAPACGRAPANGWVRAATYFLVLVADDRVPMGGSILRARTREPGRGVALIPWRSGSNCFTTAHAGKDREESFIELGRGCEVKDRTFQVAVTVCDSSPSFASPLGDLVQLRMDPPPGDGASHVEDLDCR